MLSSFYLLYYFGVYRVCVGFLHFQLYLCTNRQKNFVFKSNIINLRKFFSNHGNYCRNIVRFIPYILLNVIMVAVDCNRIAINRQMSISASRTKTVIIDKGSSRCEFFTRWSIIYYIVEGDVVNELAPQRYHQRGYNKKEKHEKKIEKKNK